MSAILKVDVNGIRNNIKIIKDNIKKAKFCAVVKANAYGVGLDICKHIESSVDYFAVANVYEAENLALITSKPILVLSPPSIEEICQIKSNNIEFAVDDINIIKWLSKTNREYKIHIAVNTGMNRFGVKYNLYKQFFKILLNSNTQIVGVFSHFWGENISEHTIQNDEFLKYCKYAKNKNSHIICHIANSIGKNFFHDMVRIGIDLYSKEDFDCLSLHSQISKIQYVNAGEVVGYGGKYITKTKSKVAIIKIGYADGILRRMVGYNVLIKEKYCKIVAICMDAIIVDVSDCSAKVGDECLIFGKLGKKKISVCNIATFCDTISYEILTSIGQRVKREYIL